MPSSRLCRLLWSPFLIHLLFQNVRFLIYPCKFSIIQLWTYPLYAIHRWWEMPIANSFTEGQIVLQWLRIRGRRLFPECPPRVKPPSNRLDYHYRSSRRSRLCRLELQRSQKGFALNAVSRPNPGVGIMPQCMSWHWFSNPSFINRSLNVPVKVAAVNMMPLNNFRSWINRKFMRWKNLYQKTELCET
jgi:hypothetical protein